MCVYLASHGLIASHLAIYKQASLKNNECVKSTNANSTPGNCSWWGEGELMWARWFVLFLNEGKCKVTLWTSPEGEDGTDIMHGSSLSFGYRESGHFDLLPQCDL